MADTATSTVSAGTDTSEVSEMISTEDVADLDPVEVFERVVMRLYEVLGSLDYEYLYDMG